MLSAKQKYLSKITTVFYICILMPTMALADTGSDQISSILSGLINLLTSNIAHLVFVVAIVGIGYGWLYMGRLPKARAMGAIAGIGIIVSAAWIAQQLGIGVS